MNISKGRELAENILALAYQEVRRGNRSMAMTRLRKSFQTSADQPWVRVGTALFLKELGDNTAIAEIVSEIRQNPENSDLGGVLSYMAQREPSSPASQIFAQWLIESQQWAAALNILDQNLIHSGLDDDSLKAFTTAAIRSGHWEQAIHRLEEMAQQEPERVAIRQGLIDLYQASHDLSDAETHWRSLLRLQPDDSSLKVAFAEYQKRLAPYEVAEGLVLLAHSERERGDHERALQHLREALENDPENFHAFAGLMETYQGMEDKAQMQSLLEGFRALRPDDPRLSRYLTATPEASTAPLQENGREDMTIAIDHDLPATIEADLQETSHATTKLDEIAEPETPASETAEIPEESSLNHGEVTLGENTAQVFAPEDDQPVVPQINAPSEDMISSQPYTSGDDVELNEMIEAVGKSIRTKSSSAELARRISTLYNRLGHTNPFTGQPERDVFQQYIYEILLKEGLEKGDVQLFLEAIKLKPEVARGYIVLAEHLIGQRRYVAADDRLVEATNRVAESEQEAIQKFWDRFRHNLQVTPDNQESVASYAQHLSQLPDRLGEARRLYEQLLQLSPNLQYLKQLVELFAGRMNDDKSARPYFEQLRRITRQRKLFDDPLTQAAYEQYLDNRPLLDRLFS